MASRAKEGDAVDEAIVKRRKALAAGLDANAQRALQAAIDDPNSTRYTREGLALPLSVAKPELASTFSTLASMERLAIDDPRVLPYRKLLAIRRDAYEEAIKHVTMAPELAEWVKQMTMLHKSPTVPCWWQRLPWLTALMVGRFGEAPEKWPDRLNGEDVRRAREWMAGNLPEAVAFGTRQALLGGVPGMEA